MNILLIISGTALLLGFILFGIWFYQMKGFGILSKKKIYTDTENNPGEILYSKTLSLSGKPDYLIKESGMVFPVEVKTGHTPNSPYVNHTMQLMAYCLLVEENYGIRPTGGFLKYPGYELSLIHI